MNNLDEQAQPTTSREKRRFSSPRAPLRTNNLRLPKDRKDDYKQHFQRFVMTVYQTVRRDRSRNPDEQHIRTMLFELPQASFPKLPGRDGNLAQLDMDAQIEQALIASTKGFPNPKYKMLKNFLNNYQEIKKKNQVEGMSMLGLEVKKIDCNGNASANSGVSTGHTAQTLTRRRNSARRVLENPVTMDMLDIRHSMVAGMPTQRKASTLLECRGYATHKQPPNKFNISKKIIVDEEPEHIEELQEHEQDLMISKVDLAERTDKETAGDRSRPSSLPINSATKYVYYHDKVLKGKFKFGHADNTNTIYENKMQSYRQFLFKVHFAHNVYMDLSKRDQEPGFQLRNDAKYKAWVGPGNNCLLVRGLIKRRFWWVLEQTRCTDTSFVWTQIKVNDVFRRQPTSKTQQKLPKPEDEEDEQESQKKIPIRSSRKRKAEPKEDGLAKLLTAADQKRFRDYSTKHESKHPQKIQHKKQHLGKPLLEIPVQEYRALCHNHIENNFFLGNKKAMFHNLKQYYQLTEQNVFDNLPLTFHIRNGLKCAQYKRFIHYYKKRAAHIKKQQKAIEQGETRRTLRNIWIVKPGELSNRGNGITVVDEVYELNKILSKKQQHGNGTTKTYIVQLYLDRPLLYNRRKFDIRHYMLITNMFGVMRGYWYAEGYVRTASYEFDVYNFERQIHLTNDAVQKHTALYGRYEPGNKLSYTELQRYLDATYPNKHYSLASQILPKMKEIGRDAVRSAYLKLSPNNLQHNFEILGLDFMIDENFKPWLIEINTNPCLELSCPLLGRIIPLMVQQSLRLSLDVVFPPPCHYSNTTKHLAPDMSMEYLKYQLIFDSLANGQQIRQLYRNVKLSKLMDEIGQVSDDEQYADEGQQIKLEDIS